MLWSRIFLLCLSFPAAFPRLLTTIIDDAFPGDAQSSISYSPPDVWVIGSASNHGRVAPDVSQAQDGTWHDTTDDTTPDHDGTTPTFMEVTFQGTGIDVRCIIANNLDDPSIPPFTGTKSNYSFFLDTVPQSRDFVHEAGTTGDAFLYNTSVFSTNGLSNSPHTLKLLLNGGPQVNGSVLLLFDYAIVTSDDGTGESGTPSSILSTPETPTILPAPGPSSKTAAGTSANTSSTSLPSPSSRTSTPVGSASSPGGTSLSQAATSSTSTPTPSTPTRPSSSPTVPSHAIHKFNIGAIIGGAVGGLFTLVILLIVFIWTRRRLSIPKIPHILPLPYYFPHFRSRPLTWRKTDQATPTPSPPSSLAQKHNPNRAAQSTPSATSSEPNSDPAMWGDVQRLRAEVELLRGQQREMVATEEPPPRYEDS
ncbi:hypothetical protein DFH06DRAFT_1293071 [Mycena polygramma]|nr:hypothetical protein DFH06DRAFT_1293071 [Mycena polygramma]